MPRRRLRRHKRQLLSRNVWKTRLTFWSGAVLVGGVATLLALGSEYANQLFRIATQLSALLPLILTPLGLMLVVYLTRRYFPGAEGSGIPQAMAALAVADEARRDAVLSLRVALGKSLLIVLGLLCGASIGREGPTVHVAASLMYAVRRLARFPHPDISRGLILAGGAAGIAAAFNTPLAGVVFAIEEMSRSFEERTSGTVVTAVIIAGMTSLSILGNYHYFGTVHGDITPLPAALAVLLYGVVGGLLGGLFSYLVVQGARRLSPYREQYAVPIAGVCGLAIAIIGLISANQTYGTGYLEARGILTEESAVGAAFPILKMLATLVSYWSGIPGGIFAPTLATGAGIGAELAALFTDTPLGALAILGMVGYFAGVLQTPITAVVIVMELTDNQSLLLPLLATAFIATGTSRLLCAKPIYQALAEDYLRRLAPPRKPRGHHRQAAGETHSPPPPQ